MSESSSTLTTRHILVSMLLFTAIPFLARFVNAFVVQDSISLMFSMNICASLLVFYNWKLIDLHLKRYMSSFEDSVLFTIIGAIALWLWLWVGQRFLQAETLLPERNILIAYGYARPGMLIAFSLMKAFAMNITFKVMTDHMNVAGRELETILISGFLFGFLLTVLYTGFDLGLIARTYLYNVILSAVLSYLYNQTNSILTGTFALTLVSLASMILSIL